jgi:hypothetical protein
VTCQTTAALGGIKFSRLAITHGDGCPLMKYRGYDAIDCLTGGGSSRLSDL